MHLRAKSLRLAVACAWACASLGGCAGLPRIDPTGERVFIWPKDQPRVAAPLLTPSATVVAPPVNTDPVFPALATVPATSAVTPGVTPAALALAQVPQDRVTISPERILAPVNSEVVLKAAVCTTEGYTLADQKVEWMLGRNGVGQFVEVSGKGMCHPPLLPWNQGKKIDNYLAQGYTASDDLCITRGTADPADDVNILRGDAWVTVTSPNEGTSHVTAFMPRVDSWEQRRSSATIYWVDVQWNFPPGTVASDGRSATLTTTVTRQTNGTPIEGWLVRYELADGSSHLASGAGGQVVEVRTDANGQATVQATPTAAGAASTPVNIQLIRPAGFGGGDAPRLIVGSGTSTIQWSGGGAYLPPSAGPATPVPTIPETAPGAWQPPGTSSPTQPGGAVSIPPIPAARPQLELELQADSMQPTAGGKMLLTFRLRNTGTARATGVRVIDQFDYPGLRYSRDPNATEVDANAPTTLEPGADISHPIEFDVARPGRLCHNVRVTSAEGATDTAQLCVNAVDAPVTAEGHVTVRKTGPQTAIVGEEVVFRVTVENTGELPLVNLRVVDEYPPAYFQITPPVGASVVSGKISYVIDRLERGQKKTFEDVRALCLQPAVPLIDRPLVTVEAETSPPTTLKKSADEVEMEIRPRNPGADPAAGGPGGGAALPGAAPALRVGTEFLQRPARVNSRTTCVVTVLNSSQINDEQVELRLVLPPQLTPDLSAAGGLAVPPGVQATMNDRSLNDRQLSFSPLMSLRRGERQTYQIPMTVVGPAGIVEVTADVRSRNYAGGVAQQPVQLEITNQ